MTEQILSLLSCWRGNKVKRTEDRSPLLPLLDSHIKHVYMHASSSTAKSLPEMRAQVYTLKYRDYVLSPSALGV